MAPFGTSSISAPDAAILQAVGLNCIYHEGFYTEPSVKWRVIWNGLVLLILFVSIDVFSKCSKNLECFKMVNIEKMCDSFNNSTWSCITGGNDMLIRNLSFELNKYTWVTWISYKGKCHHLSSWRGSGQDERLHVYPKFHFSITSLKDVNSPWGRAKFPENT